MSTDVKVPGIGPVNKKYVYGAAGLTAVIVGYAYMRRGSTAGSGSVYSDPNAIDPATGLTYAQESATFAATASGYVAPAGLQQSPQDLGPVGPSTDAEWANDAVGKMVALSFDSQAVSTALGLYLSNQPVSSTQANYIRTALALAGPPPSGYRGINVTGTTSTTPPPTGGGSNYVGAQWHAGQDVGGQGTRGVGIGWGDLAKKALSSNTLYTSASHTTINNRNVFTMAAAMQAKNPKVFAQFPGSVPLYRVPHFIIPSVPGLNAPK